MVFFGKVEPSCSAAASRNQTDNGYNEPSCCRGLHSVRQLVTPKRELDENSRLRSMDLTCPELRPYGFGGGGAGFFGAA